MQNRHQLRDSLGGLLWVGLGSSDRQKNKTKTKKRKFHKCRLSFQITQHKDYEQNTLKKNIKIQLKMDDDKLKYTYWYYSCLWTGFCSFWVPVNDSRGRKGKFSKHQFLKNICSNYLF